MLFDHIKVIEFEEQLGPHRMEKVALYNGSRLSDDEAFRIIRAGEYSDNVLVIPKRQWVALFGNGRVEANNERKTNRQIRCRNQKVVL